MIHEMRVNHDVERALLVLNLHKNTRVNFGVLINKSDLLNKQNLQITVSWDKQVELWTQLN